MNLRFASKALRQVEAIHAFIAADNPNAADRVLAKIEQACERVSRFPYSGRPSDWADIRVVVVPGMPYIAFYTIDEARQVVTVLRVRHTAQDPSKHLD